MPWFHINLLAGTGWLATVLVFVIYAQTSQTRWFRQHGLSPIRETGFCADTFGRSFIHLLPFVVASLALVFLLTITGWSGIRCRSIPLRYLFYFPWALAQQYLLQAFVLLRLRALGKSRIATSLLAAMIFASLHIPNPTLTITTLFGGWILCYNFLTHRNLFSVALAHGIVAASMECFLPKTLLPNMYVGIFYFLIPGNGTH